MSFFTQNVCEHSWKLFFGEISSSLSIYNNAMMVIDINPFVPEFFFHRFSWHSLR